MHIILLIAWGKVFCKQKGNKKTCLDTATLKKSKKPCVAKVVPCIPPMGRPVRRNVLYYCCMLRQRQVQPQQQLLENRLAWWWWWTICSIMLYGLSKRKNANTVKWLMFHQNLQKATTTAENDNTGQWRFIMTSRF
jgi:hypothetical protein